MLKDDVWDGERCYLPDGTMLWNTFFDDGTYTYYLMWDGTPMKDRLTCHPDYPDANHIIYFDEKGHEAFNSFKWVGHNIADVETDEATELNEFCYFGAEGYQYTDVLTYGNKETGTERNLMYANQFGILERKGWFEFSSKYHGGYGYANADATLMTDQYTFDWNGNMVYMEADGHVRGSATQEPDPEPDPETPLMVNSTEVALYGLDKWAEDYLTVPENMATSFQLVVSGPSNPTYKVISGGTVEVNSDGLITPKYNLTYWYNNVGYSKPIEGMEPTKITKTGNYGESTVRVTAGDQSVDVTVSFQNYASIYADQVMEQYIAENIKPSMTAREKVEQACKFAASYDYSGSYSSAVRMIICGGGDCWASTDAIIRICEKLGMKAWLRNGNRDAGAGSGHMNAMVEAEGMYYEAEAGYVGTAPRYYSVKERTSLYSYYYYNSYEGIEIYQYDGPEKIAVHKIPEEIDGQKVVGIGRRFLYRDSTVVTVELPSTLQYIRDDAFAECSSLEKIILPESLTDISDTAFDNCSNVTIYAPKGSYAESYAIEKGYAYVNY